VRKYVIVFGGLAATACASTSDRIATELMKAGLSRAPAECIGQSLERDLSIGQLTQLARAARAYRSNDTTPGRLTVSDLLRMSGPIKDPAVPFAIAKAAGSCA
jgi:hypothetical protein